MRKQFLTLSFIITSLVFVGCTSETSDKEEIELSQAEISEQLMEVVKKEQNKQVEIIKTHYKSLSNGRQSELSPEEYYQELAIQYKSFTERALEKFKEMSQNGNDERQIQEMREQLRQEMGIPDWFWEMKETSNEIIREAALK
ncbi:MAG: hypothetical protein WBA74_26100 [Cyclobacteriaceae bacterium]